jgi:Ni,Fe-hydrogenase III small subunit
VSNGAFDFLRSWRANRGQTVALPLESPAFPGRFRGRPAPRELPTLDLGACLFSPEERSPAGWTHDIRMASRTREGLLTGPDGALGPAPLDEPLRRLLGRSLRLRSVAAGSCNGCEAELTALGNVVFDLARFGVQFVASPRHADGIIITGTVNVNMRDALERTYAAVPDPRIVIAVGACAASGGPFRGSPEILGIPAGVPVDLWVPGCPPHPLAVLDGILRLLGRHSDAGSPPVSPDHDAPARVLPEQTNRAGTESI